MVLFFFFLCTKQVKDQGTEYDTWFDYIKLEENHAVDVLRDEKKQIEIRKAARRGGGSANVRGEDGVQGEEGVQGGEEEEEGVQVAAAVRRDDILAATREKYERAISNVPPIMEKKYWRRYIYLWIKYALFEVRSYISFFYYFFFFLFQFYHNKYFCFFH